MLDLDPADFTYDLTMAATVQEEIGLVGAQSLGGAGRFDLAIAIDDGPIADYPGIDDGELRVCASAKAQPSSTRTP
ncbi:MAG: hypothetical protein ACR2GI_03020 [Thermomicrobiales bacterium]